MEGQNTYNGFKEVDGRVALDDIYIEGQNGWSFAPGADNSDGAQADRRRALYTGRSNALKNFFCPSDGPPITNEPSNQEWARSRGNYRGCVGDGNMNGTLKDTWDNNRPGLDPSPVAVGKGYFSIPEGWQGATGNPSDGKPDQATLAEVTDGTSNTIMFSEGLRATRTGGYDWGGVMGEITQGRMGGNLFTTYTTPNTSAPDITGGEPCPQDLGDSGYKAPCVWGKGAGDGGEGVSYAAARSKHAGGVNAALGDGSVRFFSDSINVITWRELGTRAGGEVVDTSQF
jgi:prepilin-type processing-associated H-X9-DG protein